MTVTGVSTDGPAPPATAARAPARRALESARAAMSGRFLDPPPAGASYAGAASDSRAVTPGRLFFALPGERADGFSFAARAAAAGAAAIVVAEGRGRPDGVGATPVIAVVDPRRALGDLARAARDSFSGRVVGVTGSNGKTTTKELVAAALSPFGAVLRTAGNLNTDVGLPLTILEAAGDEAFWVLEMAMRARGEIAYLARIARPHVGVVTNVAAAHLGVLGSLDEIAKAKCELFHELGDAGVAILPAGDARIEAGAAHLPESRKRRFVGPGRDHREVPAAVRLLDFIAAGGAAAIVRMAVGPTPIVARIPLGGEHNARNAAAALAVAHALGLDPVRAAAGLARVELPPHRSRFLAAGDRTIIDDCYNANPASMIAALRMLALAAGAAGRAYAILGDMLELGPDADELHAGIGREAVRLDLAGLAAVGPLAARIAGGAIAAGFPAARAATCASPEEAARLVAPWTRPGDFILVKGSRGTTLERALPVLESLLAAPGRTKNAGDG